MFPLSDIWDFTTDLPTWRLVCEYAAIQNRRNKPPLTIAWISEPTAENVRTFSIGGPLKEIVVKPKSDGVGGEVGVGTKQCGRGAVKNVYPSVHPQTGAVRKPALETAAQHCRSGSMINRVTDYQVVVRRSVTCDSACGVCSIQRKAGPRAPVGYDAAGIKVWHQAGLTVA